MFTDFSDKRAASKFRAREKSEDGDRAFLKKLGKLLPGYTALNPRS
jgi:hypothetical protein